MTGDQYTQLTAYGKAKASNLYTVELPLAFPGIIIDLN
jgi:ABC-type proline/glycine betaine transport system permease subunit